MSNIIEVVLMMQDVAMPWALLWAHRISGHPFQKQQPAVAQVTPGITSTMSLFSLILLRGWCKGRGKQGRTALHTPLGLPLLPRKLAQQYESPVMRPCFFRMISNFSTLLIPCLGPFKTTTTKNHSWRWFLKPGELKILPVNLTVLLY